MSDRTSGNSFTGPSLAQRIERAFDGVQRDAVGGLRVARAWDEECSPSAERQESLSASERHRRWADISASLLNNHGSVLPFLSPVDFRYYLPAYMTHTIRCLTDRTRFNELWVYAAFDGLSPSNLEILTREQRGAAADFLYWLWTKAPLHPDDKAEFRNRTEEAWEMLRRADAAERFE